MSDAMKVVVVANVNVPVVADGAKVTVANGVPFFEMVYTVLPVAATLALANDPGAVARNEIPIPSAAERITCAFVFTPAVNTTNDFLKPAVGT
jgi:hypothetical protein